MCWFCERRWDALTFDEYIAIHYGGWCYGQMPMTWTLGY